MAYITRMKAQDYIEKSRDYLDYVEEHIENVRLAFIELTNACKGTWWVGDDATWHAVREEVINHDLSKLSVEEFVQYRQKFHPVGEEESPGFDNAWMHHYSVNHHHHESAETLTDIVHMVIDWTAMGYKFNDTAQQYYEANADRITLTDANKAFMFELFACLEKYRRANGVQA